MKKNVLGKSHKVSIPQGKWGKVITRGKLIFRFAGFNRQMTQNDKEEKLILLLLRNF